MAFQAVPDGIEVVFEASQNGIPIVNVYNIRSTVTHDEAHLTDVAGVFFDWWEEFVKPGQHNSYVLNAIKVTSLELSTGPQVIVPFSTGNQGDLTGTAGAANAAAVISWRTASIGRSFRGRTYIGALAAVQFVNAQFMTTGDTAFFADAGTALIDALQTFGAALCVLSRYASGVLRVTGLLTEIISVIVDQVVDSQRRRNAN